MTVMTAVISAGFPIAPVESCVCDDDDDDELMMVNIDGGLVGDDVCCCS